MNRSKEIEAEWIGLAPGIARSGFIPFPYRIPEGYFNGFYERLILRIRKEQSGMLSEGVTELSAEKEIESISPLLAGIPRKTPYQVPADYFARFSVGEQKAGAARGSFDTELSPVMPVRSTGAAVGTGKGVSTAPVIRMTRSRGWMRIAAAAVVTAVILTGAFFYMNPAQPASVSGQLAQVSDQDMLNFMENTDMPAEVSMEAAASQTGPQSFSDNEVSDLMSNVSDDELEHYYAAN